MAKQALVLIFLLLPSPAIASICQPFHLMVDRLLALGERPVAYGMQNSGHQLYVFANPDNLVWTIVRRYQENDRDMLCIVSMGEGWVNRKRPTTREAL